MNILLALGLIIVAFIVIAVYRAQKVKRQNASLNAQRFDRDKPLLEKLNGRQSLSSAEVLPYAESVLTRESAYELLKRSGNLARRIV